jgi:hypothetical protein
VRRGRGVSVDDVQVVVRKVHHVQFAELEPARPVAAVYGMKDHVLVAGRIPQRYVLSAPDCENSRWLTVLCI